MQHQHRRSWEAQTMAGLSVISVNSKVGRTTFQTHDTGQNGCFCPRNRQVEIGTLIYLFFARWLKDPPYMRIWNRKLWNKCHIPAIAYPTHCSTMHSTCPMDTISDTIVPPHVDSCPGIRIPQHAFSPNTPYPNRTLKHLNCPDIRFFGFVRVILLSLIHVQQKKRKKKERKWYKCTSHDCVLFFKSVLYGPMLDKM